MRELTERFAQKWGLEHGSDEHLLHQCAVLCEEVGEFVEATCMNEPRALEELADILIMVMAIEEILGVPLTEVTVAPDFSSIYADPCNRMVMCMGQLMSAATRLYAGGSRTRLLTPLKRVQNAARYASHWHNRLDAAVEEKLAVVTKRLQEGNGRSDG